MVADAMIKMLRKVDSVLTITLDNGGEFADHVRVAKATGADVYFAKPYASWRRGTNENTNGRNSCPLYIIEDEYRIVQSTLKLQLFLTQAEKRDSAGELVYILKGSSTEHNAVYMKLSSLSSLSL